MITNAVYNTTAVTYVPGKNAGWHLAQGGGVTRLGAKSAVFIVHANGEVISRHGGSGGQAAYCQQPFARVTPSWFRSDQ